MSHLSALSGDLNGLRHLYLFNKLLGSEFRGRADGHPCCNRAESPQVMAYTPAGIRDILDDTINLSRNCSNEDRHLPCLIESSTSHEVQKTGVQLPHNLRFHDSSHSTRSGAVELESASWPLRVREGRASESCHRQYAARSREVSSCSRRPPLAYGPLWCSTHFRLLFSGITLIPQASLGFLGRG